MAINKVGHLTFRAKLVVNNLEDERALAFEETRIEDAIKGSPRFDGTRIRSSDLSQNTRNCEWLLQVVIICK